ncbi:MAG: TIR domain-containing protein, partial [Campylobacterales bacterium]
MDSLGRKKVAVITTYILESFSQTDWLTLGQITGGLKTISEHPRLLRSLSFGDDDYPYCVNEVLESIFTQNSDLILDVIEHFDIELWFSQKDPEKYKRIFGTPLRSADFWVNDYLRLFVSHLSSNRERMSAMKAALSNWGISAFVAHEDIEASKEWRDEVEAGLDTMDVLVAVVEPGFKESDWCVQEVGYALGGPLKILCQSDRILNPKGLTHEPNKPAVRSRHRFSADQGRSQ